MNSNNIMKCYTIGHSNHDINKLANILAQHNVNCLIDVRSAPYSKFTPQFNKESIQTYFKNGKIKYLYLGNKLGGRYTNPDLLFPDGKVDFSKVRKTRLFLEGINEIIDMVSKGIDLAIMCSEKNPFDCHRFALVSHDLSTKGVQVSHILEDGSLVSNSSLEEILLKKYKKTYNEPNLFEPAKTKEKALEEAYEERNKDIAYDSLEEKGRLV